MSASGRYDNASFPPANKIGLHHNRTSITSYRNYFMYSVTMIFVVITAHAISGCMSSTVQIEHAPAIAKVPTATYPNCSSDRKDRYTIIEVPKIHDIKQAPQEFFSLLHQAIMEEGRRRNIYNVVPSTTERDKVVLLIMFVGSWRPDVTQGGTTGLLSMKLFLIDKTHHCQVGQTTGHGKIRHDPETGFNHDDIHTIAESAGWFVGITLMHDP